MSGRTQFLSGRFDDGAGPKAREKSVAEWRRGIETVLKPSDEPMVATGEDARVRVLILGGGAAVGLGVAAHTLALTGELARTLTRRTGRTVQVETVSEPALTVREARDRVDQLEGAPWDAVVLTLGFSDAYLLTPPASWRGALADLVAAITKASSAGTEIVILGVNAIIAPVLPRGGVPTSAAAGHAAKLNAASEGFCRDEPQAWFVPPVALPPSRTVRNSALRIYADCASAIADVLAPALDAKFATDSWSRTPGAAMPSSPRWESERQQAIDALNILDTGPEDRFDRIVGLARRVFMTDGAVISIIDRHRVWHKAVSGSGMPQEIPRYSSFCEAAISVSGPLVVPDALADRRFVENPLVTGTVRMRFYAGWPLFAPSGQPIGTLCVFDRRPRSTEDLDRHLLHELALLAQAELHNAP